MDWLNKPSVRAALRTVVISGHAITNEALDAMRPSGTLEQPPNATNATISGRNATRSSPPDTGNHNPAQPIQATDRILAGGTVRLQGISSANYSASAATRTPSTDSSCSRSAAGSSPLIRRNGDGQRGRPPGPEVAWLLSLRRVFTGRRAVVRPRRRGDCSCWRGCAGHVATSRGRRTSGRAGSGSGP